MSNRISKKEIANLASVNPRTMRRNNGEWRWLDKCRIKGTRRASFNRQKVEAGLKSRGIL